MSAEEKLKSLGLSLPVLPTPMGNYVPFRRDGNTVYLSGRGPRGADGKPMTGKVGRDITLEEGVARARLAGIGLLSVMKAAAGSLDNVEVVKVFGLVNTVPEFTDHAKVIDGCSSLLVEVLGERGKHARSAVGAPSLPADMSVEVEAIIRIVS